MLISHLAACKRLCTFSWLDTPQVIASYWTMNLSNHCMVKKPHTVISKPSSCGAALDTLLNMCLHITFIHSVVWLWFAAWLPSMTALSFSTDQIASLMAWDDDTGWNFFHCCSKTTSFMTTNACRCKKKKEKKRKTTFMDKHRNKIVWKFSVARSLFSYTTAYI